MNDEQMRDFTERERYRFWSHVTQEEPDSCWEWAASRLKTGYGSFYVHGKTHRAHRVAWQLTHGPIPEGFYVCHQCDNRGCVNPLHLFLGTHTDNVRDMVAKGRHVTPTLFGEDHPRSVLSLDEVIQVKERLAMGESRKMIANSLRIGISNVGSIARGETWMEVSL